MKWSSSSSMIPLARSASLLRESMAASLTLRQVVDGEEVHALDGPHLILDITGLGDIDEDQVAGMRVERPEALLHYLP